MSRNASFGTKFFSVALAIAFLFAVSGCQYAQTHEREATGAGVGAAGGAAVGLLAGGTKGAIAGGLLGALAGGAIAHYTGERNKNETQTAREYNYQASQGTQLRIERAYVSPETINPGGTVHLNTTYALLVPSSGETASVTEKWEIRHNGELVGNPRVTVNRTGGTYTADLPLQLPQNAARGDYTVTGIVQTAGASDSATTGFTVR